MFISKVNNINLINFLLLKFYASLIPLPYASESSVFLVYIFEPEQPDEAESTLQEHTFHLLMTPQHPQY